jgi:hypothetical protein
MADRFDEVARLKELEKKATPTPWYYGVHPDNCDTCEDCDPDDTGMCDNPIKPDFGPIAMISSGDVVPGIFASVVLGEEDNPNGRTIANLRNAAPWLLEVAGCFQPGDGNLMGELISVMDAYFGEYYRPHKAAMHRLLQAAKIMEEKE